MPKRPSLPSLLAVAALLASVPHAASALEFSVHPNDSPTENAIWAKGPIVTEDAFRFQAYLSRLPDKKITSLYLESHGGSLYGALALGRQVSKASVRTYVLGDKGFCNGVCTYVFMAGKDSETGKAYRVKGSQSSLGFQNFILTFEDKLYEQKDAQRAQANAQKTSYDLALYFDEIDADLEVLGYGLKQKDTYYLKNEEALPLGIHIFDTSSNELVLADAFRRRLRR